MNLCSTERKNNVPLKKETNTLFPNILISKILKHEKEKK